MTLDINKLKVGDYLSETQYYEVLDISRGRIRVKNERDYEFEITFDIAKEGLNSASQYLEEKRVTATEIAEIFETVGDAIFTVVYYKKPKVDGAIGLLQNAINKSEGGIPLSEIESVVDKIIKGERRTLTGYLLGNDRRLGRSLVIDLTIPSDKNRVRQVDARTIESLIFKDVKYKVK